jgi:hypothetical protein
MPARSLPYGALVRRLTAHEKLDTQLLQQQSKLSVQLAQLRDIALKIRRANDERISSAGTTTSHLEVSMKWLAVRGSSN